MTTAQWEELGSLYGNFVVDHFFGESRFRDIKAVEEIVEHEGMFRIQESKIIGDSTRLQYVSLRAEK